MMKILLVNTCFVLALLISCKEEKSTMEDPFKNELSMESKAIFRIDGGPNQKFRFWVTFMKR